MIQVIIPNNRESLAEEIRTSSGLSRKTAITGSGSTPLPSPDENGIVISTAGLNRITDIRKQDFIIKAEAGVTLSKLVETATENGLWFGRPTGLNSTLGGKWMAGGLSFPGEQMYLRKAVTGVICINASGETVSGGGMTVKNVTGYDLTRFYAGTMGLFGIATEFILKADPLPEKRATVTAYSKGVEKTIEVLASLKSMQIRISSLAISAPEGIVKETEIETGIDGMGGQVENTLKKIESELRIPGVDFEVKDYDLSSQSLEKYSPSDHFFSFSVPFSASAGLLNKIKGISPASPLYGFPLEGRFYLYTIEADDVLYEKELLKTGTRLPVYSAEIRRNGIAGLFSAPELDLIRSLKKELDPKNILNPHLRVS
jgi:FAD/FMN-containing dehydrogenase